MGVIKAYNRYILVAVVILLVGLAMVYGWPRSVESVFPVSWVDRENKVVLKTVNAVLKGTTYHHLLDSDTFNGTLTVGDRVFKLASTRSMGLLELDGLKNKFFSKGIHVMLTESGDVAGWGVLSKSFKAFSGGLSLESDENIMFAGPALTYDESEKLLRDLFFYDILH